MLWVDQKFVGLLSSRFRNFRKVDQYVYNFSCPFCGDSKKNPRKARGYVFRTNEKLRYFCHKCNASMSVRDMVEKLDEHLFVEYIKDTKFGQAPRQETEVDDSKFAVKKPVFTHIAAPMKGVTRLTKLDPDHPALQFVRDRKIPQKHVERLAWAEHFFEFIDGIIPGKYKKRSYDQGRIVIPLRRRDGTVNGFQGRALDNHGLRYVTVSIGDGPLMYGLDAIDTSKTIYAFEGPIDSMFIDNSIAALGSDITGDLLKIGIPKEKFVIVYDNEPRSRHTVKKMRKAVHNGFKICVWPDLGLAKDVNDMVLEEKTTVEEAGKNIRRIIDENTFEGLAAQMAITSWRICRE